MIHYYYNLQDSFGGRKGIMLGRCDVLALFWVVWIIELFRELGGRMLIICGTFEFGNLCGLLFLGNLRIGILVSSD